MAVAIDRQPPTAFDLADVSFEYPGGFSVVANMSLSVAKGAIVAIVGPSGCGKSTLLSLVAGLKQPTGGQIRWHEAPSMERPTAAPDRHRLSMMFQKDTLLPWLTTIENVGLHFRFSAATADSEETRKRTRELIEMADLGGSEDKYPYQLSGGMRRRVAFLASVAPHPSVLLLDEPFVSLDEPTRVAIHQKVYDIVRSLEITVVLVTHDLAEAISLCDEVIILSGRPTEIVACHKTPFGNVRNMYELRQAPEFLESYGYLWSQLSRQIRAASAVDPSPNIPEMK